MQKHMRFLKMSRVGLKQRENGFLLVKDRNSIDVNRVSNRKIAERIEKESFKELSCFLLFFLVLKTFLKKISTRKKRHIQKI